MLVLPQGQPKYIASKSRERGSCRLLLLGFYLLVSYSTLGEKILHNCVVGPLYSGVYRLALCACRGGRLEASAALHATRR